MKSFHPTHGSKNQKRIDRAAGRLNIIMVVAFSALVMSEKPYNQREEAILPEITWLESEAAAEVNPMLPALVRTESNGRADALSKKGAAGMYQIMPETARNPGYGVKPLQGWDGKDPRTAPINEQKRLANDLLNAYQAYHGGNSVLAAASYNAGVRTVVNAMREAKGDIHKAIRKLPTETQNYVVSVAGYKPPQQMASLTPITYRYSPWDAVEGR